MVQIILMGFNFLTVSANTYRFKLDSFFVGLMGMLFVGNWFSDDGNVTKFIQPENFDDKGVKYVDCNVLLQRLYKNPIYKFTQYIKDKYNPNVKHLYIACFLVGVILLIIAIIEEKRVYDTKEFNNNSHMGKIFYPKPGKHSYYREIFKYVYMVIVCGYFSYVSIAYGYYVTLQINTKIDGLYNIPIPKILTYGFDTAFFLYVPIIFSAFLWICHLADYISFDVQKKKYGYITKNNV